MRNVLYTIAVSQPGKLSTTTCPNGGDRLAGEIAAWKHAGVDVMVSLQTEMEREELDVVEEPRLCREQQIDYIAFPIGDYQTPAPMEKAVALVADLAQRVQNGQHVAIHCHMAIGRSTMIAAGVLITLGHTPEQALALIASARGCEVPDTKEQRAWVLAYPSGVRQMGTADDE